MKNKKEKGGKKSQKQAQANAAAKEAAILASKVRLDTLRSLLPEFGGTKRLSLNKLHELIAEEMRVQAGLTGVPLAEISEADDSLAAVEDTAGTRKVVDAPQA